jgi:hypothetical protein
MELATVLKSKPFLKANGLLCGMGVKTMSKNQTAQSGRSGLDTRASSSGEVACKGLCLKNGWY